MVTAYKRRLAELKDLFADVLQKVAHKVIQKDAEVGRPGPSVKVVEFILEIEIARRR